MIGLTVFVLAGGFVLGIPVLSVVYGVDLAGYKTELMVLLLGGGFLAYTSFYQMILTVIRRQNWLDRRLSSGDMALFLLLGQMDSGTGRLFWEFLFFTRL